MWTFFFGAFPDFQVFLVGFFWDISCCGTCLDTYTEVKCKLPDATAWTYLLPVDSLVVGEVLEAVLVFSSIRETPTLHQLVFHVLGSTLELLLNVLVVDCFVMGLGIGAALDEYLHQRAKLFVGVLRIVGMCVALDKH